MEKVCCFGGSHGCFRLANWDANRLAQMVQIGTPVDVVE